MPPDINRKSYNAIASSWDAARHSFYGRERDYLNIFLEGLPVPSRILDLGCGTGRPLAEYILSRGHDLTGVDEASKLLEFARWRFPQGNWIESRIQDFDSTHHFAGVVCWDTLFHVERSLHAGVLLRIAKVLCAGGRLMLTVGGSDHPPFSDTMFGATFSTILTRPTNHFLFCAG
jgi:2-polyprenyl-3-methyl-5-hydroxy-6-metoxy-1,4-benzoquinol methylase